MKSFRHILSTSCLTAAAFGALAFASPRAEAALAIYLNCSASAVGQVRTCLVNVWNNEPGNIVLSNPVLSFSGEGAEAFSHGSPNTCAHGVSVSGSNPCVFRARFLPLEVKAYPITFTVTSGANEASISSTYHGTTPPELQVSPPLLDCGTVSVGNSTTCGAFTLTASGAAVTLEANPIPNTTNGAYSLTIGSCTGGLTLQPGQSCTTGTVTFSPESDGTHAGLFAVQTSIDAIGLASTGVGGEAHTYTWEPGEFSACTGGTGSWQVGTWTPLEGCGEVEQTRSSTCMVTSDSGTQSRTVSCKRSDGQTVDDEFCDAGSRPAETQSCTPTGDVCGVAPSTEQSVTLSNACVAGCVPDPASHKYCLKMPF